MSTLIEAKHAIIWYRCDTKELKILDIRSEENRLFNDSVLSSIFASTGAAYTDWLELEGDTSPLQALYRMQRSLIHLGISYETADTEFNKIIEYKEDLV